MVESNETHTCGSGHRRGRGAGSAIQRGQCRRAGGGGYSIDSRTVAAGELFFAVRGERLDGHDYVAAAIERGAVAAVVSRARVATLPDAALAVPLLITEDPLIALQALATHMRRRWGKARGGRDRLGRQDDDQGSNCRGARRKVQRAQVAGQYE